MKAAHHGSKNSNCERWLELIQPDLCVISADKNNESPFLLIQSNGLGHPKNTAESRLSADLSHHGTINSEQLAIPGKVGFNTKVTI